MNDMRYDVAVVGAGQAGLAMGNALAEQRKRFVILEAADSVGSAWSDRWDSLVLFTPVATTRCRGSHSPAMRTGIRPVTRSLPTSSVTRSTSSYRSSSPPGLYFLGLSWQHTRGSALLGFVADDAAFIAARIDADRERSAEWSTGPAQQTASV